MDATLLSDHLLAMWRDWLPAVWNYEKGTRQFNVSSSLSDIYGFTTGHRIEMAEFLDAVLPEDRHIVVKEDGEFIEGHNLRYRIRHPEMGVRWIKARVKKRIDADQSSMIAGYTGSVEDITDEVEASYSLLESEERLRFAVEAGQMAIWECDLQSGTITITPELNLMFGFPRDARPTLAELRSRYGPGEIERITELGASWEVVKNRVASGKLTPRHLSGIAGDKNRTQVEIEFSINVPPGVTKYLLYRAQYVYSREGRPKITGFLVDITEKRQAEDRLAVIVEELRHRVKNSFSIVQAIAQRTFSIEENVSTALQKYLGRVQALAVANEVVFQTHRSAIDFSELALRIIAPYRASHQDGFLLTGPKLPIEGPRVTAYSLVLHELCTNALKYGALSQAGGEVLLSWDMNDGYIIVNWRERGGPPVTSPERKGFGTRLLDRMVSDTLMGTIDRSYEVSGFCCKIVSGGAR